MLSGVGPAGASAGPCPPGVGVGLLEVPRELVNDPRARSYVIDRVRPGTRFTRRLKVCNGFDARAPIEVYPDAATVAHGLFSLGDGRVPNELTSWMTVTPSSVDLPAGTSGVVTLTVSVPPDAAPGERYAAVVVQGPPRAAANGVAVTSRVGLRVYLSVGAGGLAPNDFHIESLQATRGPDGRARVRAQVRNTGPRALEVSGELSLTQQDTRITAGPFPAELGTTLAPGDSEPVTVDLPAAVTGGPWQTVLTLHSGTLQRRAKATLVFPAGAGQAAPPVAATEVPLYRDRGVLIPFAAGLAGLIALLVLLAALLSRRRRDPPTG